MTLPSQEPLLPKLWHRIKHLFNTPPAKPDASYALSVWRRRFLERCFLRDSPIEAARKHLERTWEDVSAEDIST